MKRHFQGVGKNSISRGEFLAPSVILVAKTQFTVFLGGVFSAANFGGGGGGGGGEISIF